MEPKRHEVLDDMIHTVKSVILDSMPEQDELVAEIVGNEVADRFSEKWARETIYIPFDVNYKTQLKNIKIYQDYRNGITIKEIARKYKLSIQRIYQVIRKFRKEKRKQ